MTKRILFIGSVIIVILGLVLGIYFLFFSGKDGGLGGTPNPFTGAGDREPNTDAPTGPIEGAGTVVAPHLIRITEGPVAHGALALAVRTPGVASTSPTLEDTEVRYVERKTGNVYAFRLHDRTLTRTSNKTLPGVVEAVWFPDGSQVVARFVSNETGGDSIASYVLPAAGGEGYFLQPNLGVVGVTASSTLFTLLSGSGGSTASIVPAGATSASTLFSSPLGAMTLQPFASNYVLTTKASKEVGGYAFVFDTKTKGTGRILGPFNGLSTLPDPTGRYVLFSYNYRGKMILSVFDIRTYTTTQLPVATLAEKCGWVPNGTSLYCGVPTALGTDLPDNWLQGAVSFSDRLWGIDMESRLATLIVDPVAVAETPIDMVALTMDSAEDALIFTNKIDGSLWAYDF